MILPDNWHETDATTTDWMVVPTSMGRYITPVSRSGNLRELYPVQVVYKSLLVGFNMSLRLLGKGDGRTRFDEEYYSFQVWYTVSTARIRWTTHKYGIEMPANGRTSGERYDEYPRAGLNNGNIRMDKFFGEGNGKPDHCILSIAWSEGTPCLAENNRPCHLRCQDGFHAEG